MAAKKPQIDPKEYEQVFVSRQTRVREDVLVPGKAHKGISETDYKALRSAGVVCSAEESKEAAKKMQALANRARDMLGPIFGGGDGGGLSRAEVDAMIQESAGAALTERLDAIETRITALESVIEEALTEPDETATDPKAGA